MPDHRGLPVVKACAEVGVPVTAVARSIANARQNSEVLLGRSEDGVKLVWPGPSGTVPFSKIEPKADVVEISNSYVMVFEGGCLVALPTVKVGRTGVCAAFPGLRAAGALIVMAGPIVNFNVP